MVRKLDFIVFGMPRGGTSAVSRYISSVDQLYCGLEVFPVGLQHDRIDVPQAFLERQHARWSPVAVKDVMARGDQVERYGNKTPYYIYRLPAILRELDNCPAVGCVREIRPIAMSYSTRAANPRDTWDTGRRGLFAAGDAVMLVHVLLNLPAEANVMIVPQKALLADWRAVMTKVVGHIAPGTPAVFNPERLGEIDEIKTTQVGRAKVELVDVEEEALARLEGTGLGALFTRDDVFLVNDVRDELAAIREACPPDPVAFVGSLAERHPEPTVVEYYGRWANLAGKAFRRMYKPPRQGGRRAQAGKAAQGAA